MSTLKTLYRLTLLLTFSASASMCYASAQAPDFDRYQVILSRMPFGAEPAAQLAGAPGSQPVPPAESFAKNLKMCAVTRQAFSGRLQVGLVDNVSKKNYFLTVGEEEDGISVADADYEGERALLRKGDEQVWIGMNDVSTAPVSAVAAIPGRTTALRGAAGMPPPMRRVSRRETAVPAPPPPQQILKGEELAKHLEKYQMDLIRAGGEKGPPLPMELTPEMDAQLVSEGVLPPQ